LQKDSHKDSLADTLPESSKESENSEEDLQAAIEASLVESNSKLIRKRLRDSVADQPVITCPSKRTYIVASTLSTPESSHPLSVTTTILHPTNSVVDTISTQNSEVMQLIPPEPPVGVEATRLQIRLVDGSKIQRRFLKSTPLKTVFDLIRSQLRPQDRNLDFTLVTAYPKKHFQQSLLTLEEAGLLNSSLVMHPSDKSSTHNTLARDGSQE